MLVTALNAATRLVLTGGAIAALFLPGTPVCPPAISAELEEIRQRGRLIVAVKDAAPPLGFRDAQDQLQGLEIDLARRLALELLGRADAVELRPVSNEERLSVVLDGEVDLVIARLTATPARSRLVDFSQSYYVDGTALLVKQPNWRLTDLSGRRIALLHGSSTIASVRFILPGALLVGVNSYQEGIALLESDRVDAVAADASVLTGWVRANPSYRILPHLLSAEPLSVAMPRGLQHHPLREQVNRAIERWQGEGWLQERIDYWGLPY